jgi:hypothetical protein
VKPIFLGDYITLDDSITIEDLAKSFETSLGAEKVRTDEHAFDLIVHSTGALGLGSGSPATTWRRYGSARWAGSSCSRRPISVPPWPTRAAPCSGAW